MGAAIDCERTHLYETHLNAKYTSSCAILNVEHTGEWRNLEMTRWRCGVGLLILGTLMLCWGSAGIAAIPVPEELVEQDSLLDLTYLNMRIENLYDEIDEGGSSAKYDLRRRIDRHTIPPSSPMFALHAIGKVTAAKITERKITFELIKAEENKTWGTGFMISPCHMITNYHVVCHRESVNGQKPTCKEHENVDGKPINFSFGENSDGTDFEKRVRGQVIAADTSLDYAVVRIASLVKNHEIIPYIPANFSDISRIKNSVSLSVGYPVQSIHENSHKLYGMKARLTPGKSYMNGKMTATPGDSGSPTLYLHGDVLVASGLVSDTDVNSEGKPIINRTPHILILPIIGRDLKDKNPSVLKEVTISMSSGRCKLLQ
jgi:Trypsin-like peptidase domain